MVMVEPLICLIVCSCLGSRGLIGPNTSDGGRAGERRRGLEREGLGDYDSKDFLRLFTH